MLVLTRKVLEGITIGDDIRVTVVRVEGGQVRLGIEAPRHVTVLRGELVDRPTPLTVVEAVQGDREPITPRPSGPLAGDSRSLGRSRPGRPPRRASSAGS